MKSQYATLTKDNYPEWVDSLKVSKKSPEDYLTSFANWCVKYAIKNGVGDVENLGDKLSVHISDTRGRKTLANNNRGTAVGLCWVLGASANGSVRRIEIDRETSDTLKALEIVAHEVSHAILPEDTGHKGEFVDAVFGLFKLGAIPTSTSVTLEFTELIKSWLEKAGSYPYVKFVDNRKKQTTRQIKFFCADVWCSGATEKSRQKNQGTIFYVSSGVVSKVRDFTCPVCQGTAYCDSDIPTGNYV
jgi:hypothetical protein